MNIRQICRIAPQGVTLQRYSTRVIAWSDCTISLCADSEPLSLQLTVSTAEAIALADALISAVNQTKAQNAI